MFTALMLHRYCPPGGTRHFVVANGGNLFWQGGESYPGGQHLTSVQNWMTSRGLNKVRSIM